MRLRYDKEWNVHLIPLTKVRTNVIVLAYSEHGSRKDCQVDVYDESQIDSLPMKNIDISPLGQRDIIWIFFDMIDVVLSGYKK